MSPSSSAASDQPSGAARFPPATLSTTALPLVTVRSGTEFFRIHKTRNGPVYFGPDDGQPPTSRFDSATGLFKTLYLGQTPAVAVVETLLRNPERKMFDRTSIEIRSMSILVADRDLRIVNLRGNGLQRIECDNAISTGPYEPCGAWADALWSHPQQPDGLVFRSRHDPARFSYAVFNRRNINFNVVKKTELMNDLPSLAKILKSYGKTMPKDLLPRK